MSEVLDVGGESLLVDLDDARKIRDALCIMIGMPPRREPKRKRAK